MWIFTMLAQPQIVLRRKDQKDNSKSSEERCLCCWHVLFMVREPSKVRVYHVSVASIKPALSKLFF